MASQFSREQLEKILSTVTGEDEEEDHQDMGELGMFVGTIFNDGFRVAAKSFSNVVEHVKTCDECINDVEKIFGMIFFDNLSRIEVGASPITE